MPCKNKHGKKKMIKKMRKMFRDADENDDRQLSKDEFAPIFERMKAKYNFEYNFEEFWNNVDKNKNGNLKPRHIIKYLREQVGNEDEGSDCASDVSEEYNSHKLKKDVRKLIRQFDTNKSKHLDENEFKGLYAILQKKFDLKNNWNDAWNTLMEKHEGKIKPKHIIKYVKRLRKTHPNIPRGKETDLEVTNEDEEDDDAEEDELLWFS
ncbi:hypothetical protein SNEBB_003050 [Seison nebaliae]|nr:hypothetical protein SNEBB_003050 [Seison nebaliae]